MICFVDCSPWFVISSRARPYHIQFVRTFFYKGINLIPEGEPSGLKISQRLRLLIPSHWALGSQYHIWGGYKHSNSSIM